MSSVILIWGAVFIVSLFFLIKSSDFFIDSAEKIGLYFGVPPVIIGISIVALGTSLPELASSISAVLKDSSEIVVSNVVGSNTTNILLILGLIGFIYKGGAFEANFKTQDKIIFPLTILMLILFAYDGQMQLWESGLMCAGLAYYLMYNLRAFAGNEHEGERPKLHWSVVPILLASGVAIYFSATFNIDSILMLSSELSIGKEVIALGAMALGTSLPELFVCLAAVKKNNMGIVMGNILGSNIFNIFAVMGIPGLIGRLAIPAVIINYFLPVMILSSFLFIIIARTGKISKPIASLLLLLYAGFIAMLFFTDVSV